MEVCLLEQEEGSSPSSPAILVALSLRYSPKDHNRGGQAKKPVHQNDAQGKRMEKLLSIQMLERRLV